MSENKYTYQEVFEASKEYFCGNELAAKIFVDKYSLKDNDNNYCELTPNDTHIRLAQEFARIDKEKYGLNYDERYKLYLDALDKFARIVPQGSVLNAVGNKYQKMSASNCVVVAPPADDMGAIVDTGKELAQLYKRRCGVGLTLCNLRPDGMSVSNAAKSTTGAWSFADFYSYVTRMVGQNSRRGALMLTMDVHHPDITKFATCKNDSKKVTGANISVKLTDEFLNAVEKDTDYEQRWPVEGPPKVKKLVKAKDVWNTIVESATSTADPGLLFFDNIKKNLPADFYELTKTTSSNPCCFSEATTVLVLTNNGIKDIKSVSSNDLVWVDQEKTWAKTSGYFNAGQGKIFELKLSNDISFNITENHKFVTFPNFSLVELKDLKLNDKLAVSVNNPDNISKNVINEFYFKDNIKKEGYLEIRSIVDTGRTESVGCIEVDTYHSFVANGLISGNSEIPLGNYDSCRLISINLTGYVKKAFDKDSYFDFDAFKSDVRTSMHMIDNLVDLEIERIDEIKKISTPGFETELWNKLRFTGEQGRRTGLGTHGLGDTLAQLCVKYDSNKAIEIVDNIYKTMRDESYGYSIELAKTRGPFPMFDWEKEKDCEFIQRLPNKMKEDMKKYGRRNVSILTQAPTGSISQISKVGEFNEYSTSSGVEPVFRNSYTRRKKINPGDNHARVDYVDELGDSWQEFKVYHSNIKCYLDKFNLDKDSKLPAYFITSDQIDWKKRIEIQAAEQQYIDHAISSTINLPRGTSSNLVSDIYLTSWKRGLKGITVYVDGCKDAVLVTEDSYKRDASGRPAAISHSEAPKRPAELLCDILQATVTGEKWTILIGLLENEPYEIFMGKSDQFNIASKYTQGKIVKTKKGHYNLLDLTNNILVDDVINSSSNEECAWITRMFSMSLRHGIPIEYLVDQLSKDGSIVDVNKVLARLMRKYIKQKNSKPGEACPQCGGHDLIYAEGCQRCADPNCGYSKCG